MTMASSTTKPVAIVSDIRVRLLRLNPSRYITPKVPTNDSGTATLAMNVAGMLRRNRKITATTRATASISSNSTSSTEARIEVVRSVSNATWTPSGRLASSDGSCFLIWSTVVITLAPGWRWTLRMIAGVVLDQAPSWVFSGALTAEATSLSRIGAPFV